MTVTTTKRSQKVQKFSAMGVELRVWLLGGLASWAGGFCLLGIHFPAVYKLQPWFPLKEPMS